MHRLIVLLISTTLLLAGFTMPTATATYAIGSTGPAGGKIFITPSTVGNSTGRYFEVALADVTNSRYTFCNLTRQLIVGTQNSGIGFGESNTASMIDWGCTSGAGVATDNYSFGGFSDWFLPSKDEAAELYSTQVATGVFDGADTHWTSTGFDATKSWVRYFSSDFVDKLDQTAGGGFFVRAVRSFYLDAPDAPTIGTATALSTTSASISFSAPVSNGGATIETYTATSTPGSITGQLLQAGSGSITVTGLTSSTAYTFTVTASNSAGTSSPSSASVSITTPASAEELAEQAAEAAAARDAAARVASEAATAKREAEKRSARAEILNRFERSEKVTMEIFNQAEILGIMRTNIDEFHAEIFSLPQESRSNINPVLKVARKYEVVGVIASERVKSIYSNSLIEIGLISTESKYKATLTRVVKELSRDERSTYAGIKEAIEAEMAEIQDRKDRLANILALIASRRNG